MSRRNPRNYETRKDNYFNNLFASGTTLKLPRYRDLSIAKTGMGNLVYNSTTQTLCYYTGTEWKCVGDGGNESTGCITEAVPDHGVVIDKPLFLKRHGIGRVSLDEDITLPGGGDTTIVTGDDFNLDFESSAVVGTGGPLLLLQDGNIFTAPSAATYSNSCLDYEGMYVQFCCTFNVLKGSADMLIGFDVNGSAFGQPIQLPINDDGDEFVLSVSLTDTLPLSPGDVVNIRVENFTSEGALFAKGTFITTTILGFEQSS